jgi:hypothetical protein
MVLDALRLFQAFLEGHRGTGVVLDADNTAATISLLEYFEIEHRQLQARLTGIADPALITTAPNVVFIKSYLESRSHGQA